MEDLSNGLMGLEDSVDKIETDKQANIIDQRFIKEHNDINLHKKREYLSKENNFMDELNFSSSQEKEKKRNPVLNLRPSQEVENFGLTMDEGIKQESTLKHNNDIKQSQDKSFNEFNAEADAPNKSLAIEQHITDVDKSKK